MFQASTGLISCYIYSQNSSVLLHAINVSKDTWASAVILSYCWGNPPKIDLCQLWWKFCLFFCCCCSDDYHSLPFTYSLAPKQCSVCLCHSRYECSRWHLESEWLNFYLCFKQLPWVTKEGSKFLVLSWDRRFFSNICHCQNMGGEVEEVYSRWISTHS